MCVCAIISEKMNLNLFTGTAADLMIMRAVFIQGVCLYDGQ